MDTTYAIGFSLGHFLAGAVIGGLISFIIFAVKKRWGLGFLALLACGLASFIHPIASIAAGIVFIIWAIIAHNERT